MREAIGAGGMGEVYAAYDPVLDREVALKVLKSTIGGGSAQARARFRREAQAMARLSHPNVVSVFDVGDASERVFVAMELVRGPTLGRWLGEERRPVSQIVDVFVQAGRGLEAAHAAGIVHRDFKPGNVILGERVRVVDFGLARAAHDSTPVPGPPISGETLLHANVTQTGALLGTPAYMAPEQRQGRMPTAASDQYAFAVALHEALHGVRPGEPGPRRPVPRRLRALVARALAPRPEDRYPSMAALLADLRRAELRRRGRWLVAGLLVAAGIAAAALVGRPLPPPTWSPVAFAAQPGDSGAFDYEISRDGSTAVFGGGEDIDLEPRQGGPRSHVKMPPGAGATVGFRPSFDGSQVIAASRPDGKLVVFWWLDAKSGAVVRRYPAAGGARVAADDWDVGPDGSLLVITLTPEALYQDITLVDPLGQARPLVAMAPGEILYGVTFSFDGKRAAYSHIVMAGRATQAIELASGARTPFLGDCNRADWLTDDSLACIHAGDGGFSVDEVALSEGGTRRLRFRSALYDTPIKLRTTTKGALLVTASIREHLATLDLRSPDQGLRPVTSGGATDLFPAGWTADGAVVFGMETNDRLYLMSAKGATADHLAPGSDEGVPLAVVGDEVVFARFSGSVHELARTNTYYGRAYPATGELFRRRRDGTAVSLGPTQDFRALRCAGDRAPPCLLIEGPVEDVQGRLWDPKTGERGAPVFRAPLSREGFHALSLDGKTMGRIVYENDPGLGDIELVGVDGTDARRLPWPGTRTRYLTFDPDGGLIAIGWTVSSRSTIARLRQGEPPVVLSSQPRFVEEPRISLDGTRLAVGTEELGQTYFWIDRESR